MKDDFYARVNSCEMTPERDLILDQFDHYLEQAPTCYLIAWLPIVAKHALSIRRKVYTEADLMGLRVVTGDGEGCEPRSPKSLGEAVNAAIKSHRQKAREKQPDESARRAMWRTCCRMLEKCNTAQLASVVGLLGDAIPEYPNGASDEQESGFRPGA